MRSLGMDKMHAPLPHIYAVRKNNYYSHPPMVPPPLTTQSSICEEDLHLRVRTTVSMLKEKAQIISWLKYDGFNTVQRVSKF